MASPTLFTVPIPASSPGGSPEGTFTCTSPREKVYVLTFQAPPDNRLTVAFCDAFVLALDVLEAKFPNGVVITTSAIPKFYSNGLDLKAAQSTPGFLENHLYRLWLRLLLYPMPTIALVNGHAFAGGFMTAMYHDYRVFNASKGFLCINELEFGVPLKPAMSSVFREKLREPNLYRTVVLEAKRLSGSDALAAGIVDAVGGLQDALQLIEDRNLTKWGKTGIYGIMKQEMYPESLKLLQVSQGELNAWVKDEKKRKSELVARVVEAEGSAKAKL